MYETVNATSLMPLNQLRWLVGINPINVVPTSTMSKNLFTTALCYARRSPLFAYSNVAVIEAANHSSDSSFWMQFHKPMESITCHYGWRGIIFDSMVLSMGSSAGDDDNANLDNRKPLDEHDAFIDICYTPKNKSAGRVRALAIGVAQRIETIRTRELVDIMMATINPDLMLMSGDWILRWKGFTCRVKYENVIAMVSVCRNMCEANMPVLHIFESMKVIVISSTTGVLTRPIRVLPNGLKFSFEGPYVDTMAVYNSDTMKFLNKQMPSRLDEPDQHCNYLLLTEPFFKWSTEPRENLNIQMARQGLGLDPVKGDATIMSLGETRPLIVTSYMKVLLSMKPVTLTTNAGLSC